MKKFLFLFVILAFCFLLLIFLYNIADIPYNHYLRAIQDKQKLLMETPEPRIILAGGSNLAFGIESELLKEKLKCNPVNLGLHAGINYEYQIKSIIPGIKENDIIILIPEYEHFFESDLITNELLMIYSIDKKSFSSYNYYEKLRLASMAFFSQVQRNIRQKYNGYEVYPVDSIYRRSGFNRFGDLMSYYSFHPNEQEIFIKTCIPFTEGNKFFEFTDLLIKEAGKRKARVYLTYPCLAKGSYCKESVDSYKKAITKKYESLIIGEPEDFIFEDSLFFDNRYHMNEQGKKIRTAKLIELIENMSGKTGKIIF